METIIAQLDGYDFTNHGTSVSVRDGDVVRCAAFKNPDGEITITDYGAELGLKAGAGAPTPRRRSRKTSTSGEGG